MDFHVFTTHSRGGEDGAPLQMISGEQLAYDRRAEAVACVLGALLLGALLAGAILFVRVSNIMLTA